MKVKDVMTHDIEGIQKTETVQQAAMRMKDLDIGSLAVFEGDTLIGMITDRDIAVRVIGSFLDFGRTQVGEVINKEPVTCDEDADLQEAAKTMASYKIRRLLVKDAQGVISGILTVDDIALRGEEELVAEVIKQVKERIGPRR
jgi:CBS domain-containing protein